MVSTPSFTAWGLLYVGFFLNGIATVALYSVFAGPSDGLTPVPLLSLPVAIVGGAVVGYGVADVVDSLSRRPMRAAISLGCAVAAATGQLALWSWGTGVGLFRLETLLAIGFGIAVSAVLVIETAIGLERLLTNSGGSSPH
ncbi:hypothetical protein AUR64_04920 [Haloprofundus marisrubri]|uniref:Uncharacterized protein n=1 Tax=Haloprofundus marisrubri TaxID=1514971 RepID=A0A0W1RCS5_9EURY|nr:hypothetical protein [Haloprofundus marisrubri]KTG11269.1 hypothetical protein AUR64_04920 [Haloprofundus marisrubri]